MSDYEKNVMKTIGYAYNIIKNGDGIADFNTLIKIAEQLAKHRDVEKLYLIGYFFPEKLKQRNVHHISPFPFPTFTFHNTFTFQFSPNAAGNFVVQLVCPGLFDKSDVTTGHSNLYVCSDPLLTGLAPIAPSYAVGFGGAGYYPLTNLAVDTVTFSTAVLLFTKISIVYVGRTDIESGYLCKYFY